jgi:hypothetical protein
VLLKRDAATKVRESGLDLGFVTTSASDSTSECIGMCGTCK